jgi:hypothetical protein
MYYPNMGFVLQPLHEQDARAWGRARRTDGEDEFEYDV